MPLLPAQLPELPATSTRTTPRACAGCGPCVAIAPSSHTPLISRRRASDRPHAPPLLALSRMVPLSPSSSPDRTQLRSASPPSLHALSQPPRLVFLCVSSRSMPPIESAFAAPTRRIRPRPRGFSRNANRHACQRSSHHRPRPHPAPDTGPPPQRAAGGAQPRVPSTCRLAVARWILSATCRSLAPPPPHATSQHVCGLCPLRTRSAHLAAPGASLHTLATLLRRDCVARACASPRARALATRTHTTVNTHARTHALTRAPSR